MYRYGYASDSCPGLRHDEGKLIIKKKITLTKKIIIIKNKERDSVGERERERNELL